MNTAARGKTFHAPAMRLVRCRYLDHHGDACTAEAVDPHGEILLCPRHLALALELIRYGEHEPAR